MLPFSWPRSIWDILRLPFAPIKRKWSSTAEQNSQSGLPSLFSKKSKSRPVILYGNEALFRWLAALFSVTFPSWCYFGDFWILKHPMLLKWQAKFFHFWGSQNLLLVFNIYFPFHLKIQPVLAIWLFEWSDCFGGVWALHRNTHKESLLYTSTSMHDIAQKSPSTP